MNQQYHYILGLDMGVGSVGWACMLTDEQNEPERILDLGSRIFDPQGASMEDRRIARGTRRVLRRRKARVTRTKNLFKKYKMLSEEQIQAVYQTKGKVLPNPYLLKLKGKKEGLTSEELLITLVHYAKGRGFKSNRKVIEDEESKKGQAASANEEQKLLFAKQHTEAKLKEKQLQDPEYTITNLLLEEVGQSKSVKLRNTSGEYTHGITRKMIEDEVTKILDCQIQCGVISEDFKHDFLNILLHQRLFIDGPDFGPYHKPFEKMIGRCGFTGEPRAPKSSLTYELFTLVQKLCDLRYRKEGSREEYRLSVTQIEHLVDKARNSKSITYKLVREEIGEPVKFKGLELNRTDYYKLVDELKAHPELDLREEVEKAKEKVEIFKLKNYAKLKNELSKRLGKGITLEDQQYDLIADCLTRNKSDEEIRKYLNGERETLKNVTLPPEVQDVVVQLSDQGFSEFGKVSLSFLYQILPLMIHEGKDYYEATKQCGYGHTQKHINEVEMDCIPIINEILETLDKTVTNRGVVRTLVETRKVVNAIIRKYGKPSQIHVEMARELTKSDDEKNKLMQEQQANQILNSSLRYQIFSQHPDKFRSIESIKSEDLLQYRLYLEQRGICPYTLAVTGDEQLAKIHERDLFTQEVEIDHIIPYTLCYDDRMENKTLVKKQRNQEKGNRVPMLYLKGLPGEAKYRTWIKQNTAISMNKKERYLAEKVDERFLNDYRARTINDTRYATKAFKEILQYSFPSVKVKSYTGQITAKLRGVWGLNGLTHSWASPNYKMKKSSNEDINALYIKLNDLILNNVSKRSAEYRKVQQEIVKLMRNDEIKNRDNHLHHAVDAVIIACATDKIRRRVEMHEVAKAQSKSEIIQFQIPVWDPETGEVLRMATFEMSQEDYRASNKEWDIFEKHRFPLPYYDFRKEVIIRAYERDVNVLRNELSAMPRYTDVDLQSIYPITVSHHYSSKLSGRLHKATYYGAKETENGKILTNRMAINTESFQASHLAKLYDKDGTQSYIYSAVRDWLDGYKNGLEAYKGHQNKLPLNKNGNPIKKVKLNVGAVKEEFSLHPDVAQYVEKENVVQVHIYRRENDDKLYFVGMDRFRLLNADHRDDLPLLLWWGRDAMHMSIQKKDLASNGFIKKPQVLLKGQTVKVEKRDGAQGICKIVGFASGNLEITSILGDGIDLVKTGLFANAQERYRITISTIKSIKPISIDILGEIHGNLYDL